MIKIIIKENFPTTAHASDVLKQIADELAQGNTYGTNWETIDESEKTSKINRIKEILGIWGMTTTADLELESSPSYFIISNDVCALVEEFTQDYVRVITYNDDIQIDENDVPYEDLSDELIDEIYDIIENYDVAQNKLHDSIRDEDI